MTLVTGFNADTRPDRPTAGGYNLTTPVPRRRVCPAALIRRNGLTSAVLYQESSASEA